MSADRPSPADVALSAALADGERWALEVAEDNPGHWSGHAGVAALMANYSRLQAENAELRKTCDERGEIIQSVLTEMDRRGWWAYPSTLAKDVSRALDGPELGEQRAAEATQRALNRMKGQRDA
jgi:hypothetical protein